MTYVFVFVHEMGQTVHLHILLAKYKHYEVSGASEQ